MTTNFNKKLSLVNPTKLVNDQNANAAPIELQENIEYILNFLNGNKALLSGVFGNLFDYNKDGKRVAKNSGKFDTFKKCNLWAAINDLQVSNDTEIVFDEDNERMVYVGQSSLTSNREKWLEREIWIPETLRDQKLVFALKAAGSTESTGWSTSNSVYETIAVQILGGEEEVNEFKTVGYWSNHSWFSNESYGDPMLTVYVPFQTASDTTSVKIKIFRTVNTGYLHIDRAFIGGIATPYDNDVEEYDWKDVDISELYDYDNSVTKIMSTGVMGHKVPDAVENKKGSDLVIWDHLHEWLKNLIYDVAFGCNLVTVKGSIDIEAGQVEYTVTDGCIKVDSVPTVSIEIPDGLEGVTYQVLATGTSGKAYNITGDEYGFDQVEFTSLNSCTTSDEVIESLLRSETCDYGLTPSVSAVTSTYGPSATSYTYNSFEVGIYKDIKVAGVLNIQEGSFDVLLSDAPDEDGYKLIWTVGSQIQCDTSGTTATSGTSSSGSSGCPETNELGNYFHPEKAINILTSTGPTSADAPDPTTYPTIFNYNTDV